MRVKLINNLTSSLNRIKHYKWNSIFFQYFRMFLLIILTLMLIITSIFFAYFYNNAKSRAKNNVEQSFSFLENDVNNILNETSTIYHSLIVKNSVQAFMQNYDILKLNSILKDELLKNYEFACTYISSSEYIKSVSVYSKSCKYILSPYGNNFLDMANSPDWISNSNESSLYYFIPCSDDTKNFYLCYNYYENNTVSGIIAFLINSSTLSNMYYDFNIDDVSITLTDPQDNKILLYGNDQTPPLSRDLLKDKTRISQCHGTLFTVISKTNESILQLNIKENVMAIYPLAVIFLVIIFVAILFAFIVAFVLSLRAYKTIDKLILDVTNLNYGQPDSNDASNEIIYLTTSILNIIDNNNMLENKVVSTSLNLRNLQFDILQTQLSPHFLFNALNTLHMYLLKTYGFENITSEIIISLSDLLTISLDTGSYMVTIAKEVEYTKKYINLQAIMFDNQFSTSWNISPEVMEYYTVKFSLQPVIENALSHGIKPFLNLYNKQGTIDINIYERNDMIFFEISNTGPEMSDEQLEQIRNKLSSDDIPSGKEIGMKNIDRRIKILFGEKYGCSISSHKEITTITITIPVVKNL